MGWLHSAILPGDLVANMSLSALKLVEAGSLRPLNLQRIDIEIQCDAFLSHTKVTMVWANPYDAKFEAELTFPLPEGGVVCGYSVDIDNILVPGVIVTKEKARATFEAEVRKDRGGPALIEQSVGNIFNTRINPFLPNGSRTIQVLFTQDLISQRDSPATMANIYTLPFLTPIASSCYATMAISVPGNFKPYIASPHTFIDERTDRAPQWCQTKDDQIGKYFSTFSGVSSHWSITSPFSFSINASKADSSIVIDHCGPNTISIAAAIADIPLGAPSSPALASSWSTTRIGVLWDTSKSRSIGDDARSMELNALESICRHFDSQNIEMDLFTFNMAPTMEPRRFFSKHLMEATKVLRSSEGITYHGGTNYSNLNQLVGSQMGALGNLFASYQFWIVFTDGISTFGSQEIPDLQAPCFLLSAASSGDHAFLRRWARTSNGKFWNLHTNSHADIIKGFADHSVSYLYASLGNVKLITESIEVDPREPEVEPLKNRIMVVPSIPKPLDAPKLRFYARLDFSHPKLAELLLSSGSSSGSTQGSAYNASTATSSSASTGNDSIIELSIHFGVSATAQVTHTHSFEIDVKQVLAMGIPTASISERAWAQGKLGEVQVQLESLGSAESVEKQQLEKEQLALSRHFTIVTPNTSLIVLETLQQFLDHMICPPMALPDIYKQYNKRIAARVAEEESKRFEKTSRVHTWWQRRLKWADHNENSHQRVLKDPETGTDEYDIAFRTHGISLQDFKANRQILHFAEFGTEEMNDLPITARDEHNQPWHFAMPDAKRWPGASQDRPQRQTTNRSQNPSLDPTWDVFYPTPTVLTSSRSIGGKWGTSDPRINNAIHILDAKPKPVDQDFNLPSPSIIMDENEAVITSVSNGVRGRRSRHVTRLNESEAPPPPAILSGLLVDDDSRTMTFCGTSNEVELVKDALLERLQSSLYSEIAVSSNVSEIDFKTSFPMEEYEEDADEDVGCSLFDGDGEDTCIEPPAPPAPIIDARERSLTSSIQGKSKPTLLGLKKSDKKEKKEEKEKKRPLETLVPQSGKRQSKLIEEPKKKRKSKRDDDSSALRAADAINFDSEFTSMPEPADGVLSKADYAQFEGFTYSPSLSDAPSLVIPESLPAFDAIDLFADMSFGASASASLSPPPPPQPQGAPSPMAAPSRPSDEGQIAPNKEKLKRASSKTASRHRHASPNMEEESAMPVVSRALPLAPMAPPSTTPTFPSSTAAPVPSAGPAQASLGQFFSLAPRMAPEREESAKIKHEGAKNRISGIPVYKPVAASPAPISLESYEERRQIVSRDIELDELEDNVRQVSQISKEIGQMVQEQSSMLDSIDQHVISSDSQVMRATEELSRASNLNSFGKNVLGGIGGLFSMLGGKKAESSPQYSMLDSESDNDIPTVGYNQRYDRAKSGSTENRPRQVPKEMTFSASSSSSSPLFATSTESYLVNGSSYDTGTRSRSIQFAEDRMESSSGCMSGGSSAGGGGGRASGSSEESLPRGSSRRLTRSSLRANSNEIAKQIDSVKDVLATNIDKVLDRGERIEELVSRTEDLSFTSHQFKKASMSLKRRNFRKQTALLSVILLVPAILLALDYFTLQLSWTLCSMALAAISSMVEFTGFAFGWIWQLLVSIPSYLPGFYSTLSYLAYYPDRFIYKAFNEVVPTNVSISSWNWTSLAIFLLPIVTAWVFVIPFSLFDMIEDKEKRVIFLIYLHPLVLLEYISQSRYAEPMTWDSELSYFGRWFQMWLVIWWLIIKVIGRTNFVGRFCLTMAILFGFHGMITSFEAIGRYFGYPLIRLALVFAFSNGFDFLVVKSGKLEKYANSRGFMKEFVLPNITVYGLYAILSLLGMRIELYLAFFVAEIVRINVSPRLKPQTRQWILYSVTLLTLLSLVSAAIYGVIKVGLMFLFPSNLLLAIFGLTLFSIVTFVRPVVQSVPTVDVEVLVNADRPILSAPLEVPLQLEKLVAREVKRAREFSILSDVDYSALPVANTPMMNQYDLVQFERPRFAFIDSTPEGTGRRILKYRPKFEFSNASSKLERTARGFASLEEAKKRYDTFVASTWHPDETAHIGLLFDLVSRVIVPTHVTRAQKARVGLNRETEAHGEAELNFALTALSNLAEGHLGKVQLLRAMAYQLEAVGALEEAVALYKRILELRGEEPQSYRDLALCLAELQRFDECIALYDRILTRCKPDWDARFSQIEIVAMTDLCGILPRMSALEVSSGSKIPYAVVPAVAQPIQVDLRAVLTWDVDGLDLELQVLEPNGECLNAFANQSANGGMLSRDFSGGYGPVEYLVKRAIPGQYAFRAKCRSPCTKPILGGQATLRFTLYTNYGLPEQTTDVHVLRITPNMGQLIPLACTSASLEK